jgi:hypothetical protein
MRCISIRQPWALLVCAGVKLIENRTWDTQFRGVVAVHTGQFQKAVHLPSDHPQRKLFAFGAIIGTVEIYDVVPINEASAEDWAEGPYCFRLREGTLFSNPIPHKGRVGISQLPDDVAAQVMDHSKDCVNVSEQSDFDGLCELFPPAPIDKSLLRRVERFGHH